MRFICLWVAYVCVAANFACVLHEIMSSGRLGFLLWNCSGAGSGLFWIHVLRHTKVD